MRAAKASACGALGRGALPSPVLAARGDLGASGRPDRYPWAGSGREASARGGGPGPSAHCQVPRSGSQIPATGRCVTDHILVSRPKGSDLLRKEVVFPP